MNFAFSEEQDQLRDFVRSFLEEKSSEDDVREQMETDQGFDEAVWSQMAEQMGLQALAIPEEYGGQGFGFIEQVVVLEEMGRALLCAPYFSSCVLAANTLLHSGDEDAKNAHLPGIASGETRATLAFTEESGRWDEGGITMQATPGDGGWTLDGVKSYVLDGATANLILVAARSDAGISLFAVQPDAEGLTRTALSTMDTTRKQAKLEFSGVPATLIGTDGGGWDVLSTVLDLAAVALAAEQVGGAQMCLDMSVEYAKVRVQFGRPIGSFQAIKHKCADMLLEVESAKSAAYYAGWCANEMNDELPQVASLAKSYCSEAYFHASAENIQIHGGIGFTREHPLTCTSSGRRARSCCSVIPPTTASCSPSESAFEPGTVLTTPRSYASAYGLGVLRFRCSARHGDRALRGRPGDGGDGGPTASGGVRIADRRRLDR